MNNLIYNARMALRDIMEIDVSTKGTDRVYLSLSPDPAWKGDGSEADQQRSVVLTCVDRLGDMGMILAGGENAISALMDFESVEILRNVS
jgi:hypothetical protein